MEFKLPECPVLGELNPDDLRFFYYDVAKFSELETLIELSNSELLKVANKNGIKLNPLAQQTFNKNKYSPAENEIIFTIQKSGKKSLTYQTALFNHLRNSFSHYRISYERNFFSMEDSTAKGHTMRGLVEIDKLKKFILKLHEHNEKSEQNLTTK